ncbi:MAG: sialate O-acetylesterase [Mariniblastus sp.]|nr:sialate O-acetylesterase [Mariniblastus sp.]
MHCRLLSFVIAFLVSFTAAAQADEFRFANIFGDNMVLQRNTPVTIWGWANPNDSVEVSLRDQVIKTVADNGGKWTVKLEPLGLGEPFHVTAKTSNQAITLNNVVAGEVWICSGQSNMEWTVNNSNNAKEEKANANYPLIRHVKVQNLTSPRKKPDGPNSGWTVCTPETVGNYTAVGYYFGRHLHQELRNVPIGLINTSWGGTIIETWISSESLKSHPDFKDVVLEIEAKAGDAKTARKIEAAAKKWQEDFNVAMTDKSDQWQKANVDTTQWKKIDVPGNWEGQGYPNLDGVAWYRRSVSIPASWVGKKATLSVAKIDDIDETYVNGTKVGGLSDWTQSRKYELPAGTLVAGQNSISIRVADGHGGGGIHGSAENVFLSVANEQPISLAGKWAFKPTTKTAALGAKPLAKFSGPNHPTLLHNAMVNPIVPFTVKGAIWYQGESNAGRAYQYQSLMPLLVKDWRNKWNSEMSFYWVQLANFMQPSADPGPSSWAELREAQSMALRVPKTGQAVIIDIGEANDIHPRNKQDVGIRLALNALAKDYGRSIEFSGPVYKAISIVGDQARLTFDHAEGLVAKGGKLKRFEIAGADKKFFAADAVIAGKQVIVSHPQVKTPVAVRYAWADNPLGCNLYNRAGLPASPFRSDSWKGITQ